MCNLNTGRVGPGRMELDSIVSLVVVEDHKKIKFEAKYEYVLAKTSYIHRHSTT